MRILVVEDEPKMLEFLREGLRSHGHVVMSTDNGEAGLDLASTCEFDVIVLDIELPGCSGLEVARRLRERESRPSILMLTAMKTEDDIVRGLDLGADDYVTKPFSFAELLARLRVIRPKAPVVNTGEFSAGELVLDMLRGRAFRNGQPLDLTPTEFSLLAQLMQQPGRVISRDALMKSMLTQKRAANGMTLEKFISSLRGKVDAPFGKPLIHTARGIGYYLWNSPHDMGKG